MKTIEKITCLGLLSTMDMTMAKLSESYHFLTGDTMERGRLLVALSSLEEQGMVFCDTNAIPYSYHLTPYGKKTLEKELTDFGNEVNKFAAIVNAMAATPAKDDASQSILNMGLAVVAHQHGLTLDCLKEKIYREVDMAYLVQDVLNWAERESIELDKGDAEVIAERANDDYNSDMSYWTNIEMAYDAEMR